MRHHENAPTCASCLHYRPENRVAPGLGLTCNRHKRSIEHARVNPRLCNREGLDHIPANSDSVLNATLALGFMGLALVLAYRFDLPAFLMELFR